VNLEGSNSPACGVGARINTLLNRMAGVIQGWFSGASLKGMSAFSECK
jgi:hypothetical protein